MRLKFTKMHGQGNDFVVLDGIRQRIELSSDQLRFIADRHFGIGCDQLLLVEKPQSADNDFRYRIWNSDGGEVEQCGNGARCFARFYPAWEDYPTDDLEADVRRMNAFIEERVREMPEQYFWAHKRFKTRPPGEPSPYHRNEARAAR